MPTPAAPDRQGIVVALRAAHAHVPVAIDSDLPGAGITAIFGPSGAGKTTCLRMLAGLDRGQGSVRVAGACWQDDERGIFVPVHRRAVGYVFQDHPLFSHLPVARNLDFGRKRARGRGVAIDRDFVIDLLGLAPLLERRTHGLSGGERQRVAIGQALLSQPRLVLMDEPLASLDDARKSEILPYLQRLRDELAIPILYVSHALEEIARLADHLVLLEGGRVVASGPLHATLARLDLPTALGDDAGVVIDATVAGHDVPNHLTELAFDGGALWVGRVDRPVGARVRARAHARDVSLTLDPPGRTSILNVLEGRVTEVRDSGPDRVTVRLTLGTGPTPLLARVTRRSQTALALIPGLAVHVQIKSVALLT